MANRVALITGASRGIGRGIALTLARGLGGEQCDVAINYAGNQAAAEATQQACREAGVRAEIVKANIADGDDRRRLVAETLGHFGRIDLLVNNAGVAPDVRADVLDATEESFDRLIDINLKGPYFLTQLVAKHMIDAAKGQAASMPRIVNITSISAYTAHVNRGDYGVSKAGLAMMTQVFAARLAEYGINVYEVRPGVIETDMTGAVKAKYDKLIFEEDMTPIKRWGQPEDIGRAVLAVALDLLPFSTGEVINVDGGFHMRRL
ncbi:MAG: 3-ketoacyl-ACP reductase [Phycisphaerae bacterium]